MNWFLKAVKRELERRNFKVSVVKERSDIKFVTVNNKGKKGGIYCKAHGHIISPERRKLHSLCHKMGLDSVYIASEAYSEEATHKVKVIEVV